MEGCFGGKGLFWGEVLMSLSLGSLTSLRGCSLTAHLVAASLTFSVFCSEKPGYVRAW